MHRVVFVALLGCAQAHSGDLCDRESLQHALDEAAPGTTVHMGRCRIQGPIYVPEEVELIGASLEPGPNNGIFSDEGVAVTLERRAGLSHVRVVSSGRSAVLVTDIASGPFSMSRPARYSEVTDVRIDVEHGAGLVIAEGNPIVTRVQVIGAEGPADKVGVVIRDSLSTRMEDVDVEGMSGAGVVIDQSTVEWDRGSVTNTVGVGVVAMGEVTSMLVSGVRIEGTTSNGEARSYAWIESDCYSSFAWDMTIRDNDGVGFFSNSRTALTQSVVANHGDVGIWLQGDEATVRSVDVENATELGVGVIDARVVDIEEVSVRGTSGSTWGDGLVVLGAADSMVIDANVGDNARGGLVVEYDPTRYTSLNGQVDVSAAGRFGAVAVERDGPSLVVVHPEYWDVGLERTPRAVEIDAAFSGPIDVLAEPSDWRSHLDVHRRFLPE